MKTICFLGDSITHNGEWIAEIFEYVKKDGTVLYNCGAGGDTAQRAVHRLFPTCLAHFPDTVVTMFGMNDIDYNLYNPQLSIPDREQLKPERIETHKKYYHEIVSKIVSSGITPILCTPTPYDDLTDRENCSNTTNEGLKKCAQFVKQLSKEFNCKCIDFHTELYKYMKDEQLVKDDRVHPNSRGQHFMAQIFLKEMGIISEIDPSDFVMSEKNRERFETEQILRLLEMVEWCFLNAYKAEETTVFDMLKIARERYDDAVKNNNEADIGRYKHYIDNIGRKDYIIGKLTEQTLNMRKKELEK